MAEAAWRRRFRAARITLPLWARDDAERLLYSSNASGKWELYTWDRAQGAHRQVTERPEGTQRGVLDPAGGRVWWFDDDRGDEFGRWMVEDLAGGERLPASELAPGYGAGLAVGRSFAVVGSSTDDGTSVHLICPGEPPKLLYAHREDAEVGGLSRDEALVCVSHSEHGDNRHPALRVTDLEGNAVADLWDGPGLGLWVGDWSPVPGDRRLLVQHERQDLPRPLIWRIDNDQVCELDLSLPGEIDASWYPDASALLLSHDYRGRVELYRYDLAIGSLDRIDVEPGTIAHARVRPDGEIWYDWSHSGTPPEIRAGRSILLQTPGEPAPGGVSYADHTVDGVHFFVAEPQGPRPHPTIFQVHGGPASHDRDVFAPRVQAWVDHGFAVVLVNYRGSTGYGRAWRDGLEGNPGLAELSDIASVHEWVRTSGMADPSRTILAGGSWGGYLTLLGIGVQPERWSLGIATVPVADYFAAYEDEMEPLKAFDRALFGGTPETIPEFYRERSPMTFVERVRVPVMILAGANDSRCPIRQIENYVSRLRALGKPHEVYRFDAGHGSLVVEESIRQIEAQIAFAAKHLGTLQPM